MINLGNYRKSDRTAVLTNVPIQYLAALRQNFPGMYKIRYRGPRNTVKDQGRGYMSKQSTCLKSNAVTFSAYLY